MIVRPYRPRDAEAIVHLYNSHSDSPNPVSVSYTHLTLPTKRIV